VPGAVSQRSPASQEVVPSIALPKAAAIASSPSSLPTVSPVAEETRLLRAASEALRADDPARALALLDEHGRRFPRGALAEERSVERVSALCKLGRVDEAHTEAERFLIATPDSPLAASVRASCGGDGARTGH